MSEKKLSAAEVKISRRIAYILRHSPESAGVAMDEHGWVDTEVLMNALCSQGYSVDSECLDRMVYCNGKKGLFIMTIRLKSGPVTGIR